MKVRSVYLVLSALALTACEESPTSTRTEQGVFNLLGGLAVGQTLMLSGSEAEEILLGGGTTPGEFMYIAFNASESASTLQFTLDGTNLSAPAPAATAFLQPVGRPLAADVPAPNWAMHEHIHARMSAAAAPMLANLSRRNSLRSTARTGPPRTSLTGQNAEVGQIVEINADASGPFCQGIDTRTGRVEAVSQRAIIVHDVDNPSGGFDREDYEDFARRFDELVHPTVVEYFSEPTDIDENGRVIVFFTRAVNELTDDAEDGFIGGFFWVRDLIPRALDCPASNQGEIFFLLVPDPGREASPIRHTRDAVFAGAVATIGHEYQHLINAGRRLYVNEATALETTWLDEGLSHMVEEMLFYAETGLEPRSNLDFDDIVQVPAYLDAVNQFMAQNLVRYGLYMREITSESPTSGEDDLETRGATWAFLRYLADLSPGDDAALFRLLVNNPQTGFANLRQALEQEPLDLVQDFGVSVFTDDLLPGVPPRFTQPSWNFRSLLPRFDAFPTYPLAIEALRDDGLSLSLVAGTSGYVRVRGTEGQVSTVTVSSGEGPPSDQLRVTVVRSE